MFCKTCHYSLENLTGPPHRCPECGREFDPNDASSFAAPRRWQLGVSMRPKTFVAVVLIIIVLACLLLLAIVIYSMMTWDSVMRDY